MQEEAEAARAAARAAVAEADTWRAQAEELQSQLAAAFESAEATRQACTQLKQQLDRWVSVLQLISRPGKQVWAQAKA